MAAVACSGHPARRRHWANGRRTWIAPTPDGRDRRIKFMRQAFVLSSG